jgi:NADH-quinone oxidoreductase subunit L
MLPLLPSHVINLLLITVLLPALSIPFLYILPKKVNPGWMVSAIGLLQIGLSTYTFMAVYQGTILHQSWPWFMLPHGLSVQIGIYVDLVSVVLLIMVSLIAWMVALYSISYLPAPTNFKRYFSLYSLSVTAMLWLLVADNLWGVLIGWELLSISSCLLIGFWHQTHVSMQASTYAWVVSKLGSICFLIGILLLVIELGNCDISTLSSLNLDTTSHLSSKLLMAGCCLIIAALTKSAQFPLFSWLPHAMVAPTPVSALLHTATVLSAGIYLLVRIQPILNVELNSLLVIIGHLTAFIGASAALAQHHLKRMLAYSTLSHLGYVVAAIGLGNAYIGVVYLVVHALSKACLFLIAGAIARFLQTQGVTEKEAYTLSYMGGIFHQLPWVALSYLVATGGLGIIPGLIGLRAKESILAQTFVWASHVPGGYLYYIIPLLALVGTGLTILYMGQAFVRIFLGKPRWEELPPSSLPSRASHQSNWLLQGSMLICASCVLLSSYLLDNWDTSTAASFSSLRLPRSLRFLAVTNPIGAWQSIVSSIDYKRIYDIMQLIAYGLPLLVILWLVISRLKSTTWVARPTPRPYNNHTPVIPVKAGIQKALAQARTLAPFKGIHQLFLHGWYLDACTAFLARQVLACSRLMAQVEKWFFGGLLKGITVAYIGTAHIVHWLDNQLIEGIGNGIAVLSQQGGKLYLHLQSGRTQLYVIWTCIGIGLLVVIWMVLI